MEVKTEVPMGWAGFMDVLGFSSAMQNTQQFEQLTKNLEKLTQRCHEKIKQSFSQWIELYTFSDSFFCIGKQSSTQTLQSLIEFGQYVLTNGVYLNVPLRGAIGYGTLHRTTHSISGQAITRAYYTEQKIGTSCAFLSMTDIRRGLSEVDAENLIRAHSQNIHTIELKEGGLSKGVLVLPRKHDAMVRIKDWYDLAIDQGNERGARIWYDTLQQLNNPDKWKFDR